VRVALVTSLERGGPVEHALLLAAGLSACGAEVRAAAAVPELAHRFELAGARAEVLPLRRPLDVAGARKVHRFASGADVVHAHDRRSGLWVRLGPRPRRGGSRVYTAHGLPDPYLPPPVGPRRPGPRAFLAYRCLDAALCRRADAIVVPSQAAKREFARRMGYPLERMTVIPNGVALHSEPLTSGSLVGSVAMLEPVKGIDVFLRAAARVAASRPELAFGVFGSGPEERPLRELAGALRLSERVRFAGHARPAEALSQLRVLVSSSWMETFGLSLAEAMAAGVPVVATRVGGVPELANEATAQLVPPGDPDALSAAILRLVDDPELAGRQAEAARRRVAERFSADAASRATLELYERLLA
jgi:glycosyltransferase involved in cell wall biosynthesis